MSRFTCFLVDDDITCPDQCSQRVRCELARPLQPFCRPSCVPPQPATTSGDFLVAPPILAAVSSPPAKAASELPHIERLCRRSQAPARASDGPKSQSPLGECDFSSHRPAADRGRTGAPPSGVCPFWVHPWRVDPVVRAPLVGERPSWAHPRRVGPDAGAASGPASRNHGPRRQDTCPS